MSRDGTRAAQVRVVRVRDSVKTGRDLNIASTEWKPEHPAIDDTRVDRLSPTPSGDKAVSPTPFQGASDVSEDACREALINAITHRDYSIEGQNVEIMIFDDRMKSTLCGVASTIDLAD